MTDPATPRTLWLGSSFVLGLTLRADGNRAYVADPVNGDFAIFDTSEIQARKPNPKVHELSRLTWSSSSIPQNAIPFTSRGRPYVLEPHRHLRRARAARDLQPAPSGPPARRPRGRALRPRRFEPVAGLRGPLLQRGAGTGPGRGRLLDDRLGAAGVRHQRRDAAAGDRLPPAGG